MALLRSVCVRFLKVALIHYLCGATKGCTVTAKQNDYQEAVSLTAIKLSCHFTAEGCSKNINIYWFRYLSSQHEPVCNRECKPRFKTTTVDRTAFLEISKLEINDSAIYICGIENSESNATTSKVTGQGTILVVTDKPKIVVTTECTGLIVFCTLLFIYNLVVILIYAFRSKLKLRKNIEEDSHRGDTEKSHRGQRFFHAIAQEMYHKRYARKSHNQSQHVIEEDIYQNTS
ncbi:immunoglobulin superfamily member 6 [Bombina bombina]|uniref:immunoglobulin superfamily member 6 n=1 Tax=Bombina bombina TaxID=8345 RepID=UPI00235A8D34|nr:immunoglobulin superfamily member 6 [Bombina bombina]